ncbi:UvrD-helicase domain-containing protein [Polaromonas naphthalenivorans]|uniref:Superfamily I DNA and RNA helicases-like protein n=1 Tax=Polaromonas naphthalenivorans (strain CJ2) TaxID=365044 RepID=A1VV46_POLNA|nr:UvrD-helicase domain-containing protein [Polaromonas naphthalenivorans]ABM39524.1 superfamily I DNA and RNA helicases-like protein [Polaromonas naphthalenivorans CJ2]
MLITAQQTAISTANLFGVTKVVAYAGTGKTTTLESLAKVQAGQGLSGLSLVFNKSAEQDAKKRFPKEWVTVKTINGLAHGVVSPRYKGKFRGYSLKSIEVIKFMGLAWNWIFAKQVLDTLNFWCASDSHEFPKTAMSFNGPPVGPPDMLDYAAVVAKQLWERMIDLHDEVPISHDGILKLYQLSQPRLSYPYLMLDEAQDTNPVTWDIMRRQSSPLVIVGDPYQSIYQFRGACNAMTDAQAVQTFPLTQSFRFGQYVAEIANALLWGFYAETTPLEGLGPNTRVGPINFLSPHAVISRTNAAIFSQAVIAMQAGQKIGFIGGVQGYNFNKIVDTWYLMDGQTGEIRDPFLKDFHNFEQLAEYAENANDLEVKRTIEAVQTYGASVLQIVPAIHEACVQDLSKAHLTLSTAHKCKGSTLRSVRLADDFPDLLNGQGEMLATEELSRQEVNLYYVVLTRATHELQLNDTMLAFLSSMEMDTDRFRQNAGAAQYAVVPDRPAAPEAAAVPLRRIPKAWLPEGGQMPGAFFDESTCQPTPVVAKPSDMPSRGNQIDLFS